MEIKRQKKCTKESRQRKNKEANSDWNARSETSKGALKPTSKKSPCLVSSDEKGDEKNVEGQKKRKDKISRDQKEPRQHSDGSLEDSMDSSEPTQSSKQEVKKHARKSRPTHQKDLDSGPEASEGASQVTQSSSKIMTIQQKKPWSSCEKEAVWKHLGKFKALKKVPGKQDILLCKGSEPALENRTWTDIKNMVHNTIQSEKKRLISASKRVACDESEVFQSESGNCKRRKTF
ncbi:uncharacterized protein LOC114839772 [Esox lucius]|uniref:uncharacterized protein LOC114839772 n=1 Tax=Esox lucius TaxID=8010 RepID=UPI0014769C18|nr:uncharacterized protein LOC114839772 [Esox lucius]